MFKKDFLVWMKRSILKNPSIKNAELDFFLNTSLTTNIQFSIHQLSIAKTRKEKKKVFNLINCSSCLTAIHLHLNVHSTKQQSSYDTLYVSPILHQMWTLFVSSVMRRRTKGRKESKKFL